MTALTPDCDPDMSVGGAAGAGAGSGWRSRLVLVAVVGLAAVVVTSPATGAVAFVAGALGVVCAMALVRRGLRLARRTAPARSGVAAPVLHRTRPVATAAP